MWVDWAEEKKHIPVVFPGVSAIELFDNDATNTTTTTTEPYSWTTAFDGISHSFSIVDDLENNWLAWALSVDMHLENRTKHIKLYLFDVRCSVSLICFYAHHERSRKAVWGKGSSDFFELHFHSFHSYTLAAHLQYLFVVVVVHPKTIRYHILILMCVSVRWYLPRIGEKKTKREMEKN